MIRHLLSACFFFSAGPALALSCMPHDLARTFAEAAESKDVFVVAHGTLSFDETKLPKTNWEQQDQTPPDTLIPARFSGKSLSLDGFEHSFDRPVTLNVQCFGPWCASAAADTSYLAFLEKTSEGYTFSLTPCGGFGFANPTPEMLDRVTQCMRGETCEPEPF